MAGRQQFKATSLEDWQRSDQYHNSFLIPQDDILNAVMRHCKAQGLPDIAVSTAQGKFLNLLVKSLGVRRILEVGTLGGWISSISCISISIDFIVIVRYSTIWLARALPSDGKIITLELSPHHAKVRSSHLAAFTRSSCYPRLRKRISSLQALLNKFQSLLGPPRTRWPLCILNNSLTWSSLMLIRSRTLFISLKRKGWCDRVVLLCVIVGACIVN